MTTRLRQVTPAERAARRAQTRKLALEEAAATIDHLEHEEPPIAFHRPRVRSQWSEDPLRMIIDEREAPHGN